ncbi:AbrB family transcriptional regulator [Candidatus Pacearchaeota archaeon]|nr:AbrB family transcriptional regulator [Candidatus Pacearchaeota archaeon]|tara:strand:+ start:436 stop:684 length:249 start_codon:yes stop_codon:yes gene_type:complete
MKIKEIRTAKITDKGQVCIPSVARTLEGFQIGSKVSIIVYEDKVEIKPLQKISEDLFPALATEEVLAEAWDTPEEDEAWKDL